MKVQIIARASKELEDKIKEELLIEDKEFLIEEDNNETERRTKSDDNQGV